MTESSYIKVGKGNSWNLGFSTSPVTMIEKEHECLTNCLSELNACGGNSKSEQASQKMETKARTDAEELNEI